MNEESKNIQNEVAYGQQSPPAVDFSVISKSTVPIFMFATKQDTWSDMQDQETLYQKLSEAKDEDSGMFLKSKGLRWFQELDGSHLSYFIGKDMSYIRDTMNAMETAKTYVPRGVPGQK